MGNSVPTTAGNEAPGQTRKVFSSNGGVNINAGATVNLYIVTAGKLFYLTDVHISTDSSTPILVQVTDAGVSIFEGWASTTAPLDIQGIETQPTCAAGDQLAIIFPAAATKHAAYLVSGWEQ